MTPIEKEAISNAVGMRNVQVSVDTLLRESQTLADLVKAGKIMVVGAMYDVVTGNILFLPQSASATAA